MHIIQPWLFDFEVFISVKETNHLVQVLEALPAEKLLRALEEEHWTGRKGYSVRGMWSVLIAGLLNQCKSLAETVRLLKRDQDTRMICGFSKDNLPGEDALGRFLAKLVKHSDLLDEFIQEMVDTLRELLPGFGSKLAVDSTAIPAYANGYRKNPSDPDGRWGAKKKGNSTIEEGTGKKKGDTYYWFGYKLHLVIDALYEIPLGYILTAANESDMTQLKPLLRKIGADQDENRPEVVIADKGYDSQENNTFIYQECKAAPVIPIRERKDAQLADICNAKGTPLCGCGLEMVYWGRDGNYLKYRCPYALKKAECKDRFGCTASSYGYTLKLPIAENVRRHPPIPRESLKWERLYKLRSAIERVNSRIKGLLGLGSLTVRGYKKVAVRSVLSILVMLGAAVSMAKEGRYQEIRSLVN